jgi:hypothetical protein
LQARLFPPARHCGARQEREPGIYATISQIFGVFSYAEFASASATSHKPRRLVYKPGPAGLAYSCISAPSGSVKTYQGSREIDGIKVTVDGRPLDEHYEVKQFTKWGFEWTYEGASPRQLALAILYDHLGDKDRAIDLCDPFMKKVIADLDNDWTLTEDEIEHAIEDLR